MIPKWLSCFILFATCYQTVAGQQGLQTNDVFFKVLRANNNVIIKYSDLTSNNNTDNAESDSILSVSKNIKIELQLLKVHLTKPSQRYLRAVESYDSTIRNVENEPNEKILLTLRDVYDDLKIKNADYKPIWELSDGKESLNADEIPFTIVTIKFVNKNGNEINVKGYNIRANTWKNRFSHVPEFNFNNQPTNPSLKVALIPGEYDIWAESALKNHPSGHQIPQSGYTIRYSVKNTIIKIIIP